MYFEQTLKPCIAKNKFENGTYLCDMPSEMEVELEVAPEPLQCVRSDAPDTGALYVQTILRTRTYSQR